MDRLADWQADTRIRRETGTAAIVLQRAHRAQMNRRGTGVGGRFSFPSIGGTVAETIGHAHTGVGRDAHTHYFAHRVCRN
jgi:hypothetical protein